MRPPLYLLSSYLPLLALMALTNVADAQSFISSRDTYSGPPGTALGASMPEPFFVTSLENDSPSSLFYVRRQGRNDPLRASPFADGEDASDSENGPVEDGPEHIRDNAFLVEEAFNQEAGEVQHIFNWVQLWDGAGAGRTRNFAHAFTMEIPLGSQAHQFSFTTQFLSSFEKPDGGLATNEGGVGDTFLNYRYQLLANDEFLWCAPRFSLIVPTGDERFGAGAGQLGYQFNLPVSRYGRDFDFHFNAGFTHTPSVNARLAAFPQLAHDLQGYNLGGSMFWKPRVNLNFFCETLALWVDEINDDGNQQSIVQVFLNPGTRYAVCQFDEVEWVIGVSTPIGLTADTPDIGVFAYMSVEHAFKKVTK